MARTRLQSDGNIGIPPLSCSMLGTNRYHTGSRCYNLCTITLIYHGTPDIQPGLIAGTADYMWYNTISYGRPYIINEMLEFSELFLELDPEHFPFRTKHRCDPHVASN